MAHWVREAMGFPVSLEVVGEIDAAVDAAVEAAFATLVEADRIFSPFRADSELSRINRGEADAATPSPLMTEVLRAAAAFERASGGVFSVRRGGMLDANGIVKGWAAQRAAEGLVAAGVDRFCLVAGGDVAVRGLPDPGAGGGVDAWNVGVRSPFNAARMVAVLAVRDGAVATSGAYERGDHIVDARTGAVAGVFASVTVVDDDLEVADVLATTVFAMGAEGPRWANREFGVSVLAVLPDGGLVIEGALPLAPPAAFSAAFPAAFPPALPAVFPALFPPAQGA